MTFFCHIIKQTYIVVETLFRQNSQCFYILTYARSYMFKLNLNNGTSIMEMLASMQILTSNVRLIYRLLIIITMHCV